MERFYIITNQQKDPNLEVTNEIRDLLESRGKQCVIQDGCADAVHCGYKYTDAGKIPEDTQCVLVLGGDGTLLQATRDLVDKQIPLLGINLGTLGFLAEIDRQNIRPALEQLINDSYTIEKRMLLEGCAYRGERRLLADLALNDIVLGRCGRLRIVDFSIYVNGEYLCSYSADGIIVSTPTGSTGYSLSAGGPLVSPDAELILLTAIAPHTLNSRTIVLPADVDITIEVGEGHSTSNEGAEATFDGDTSVNLKTGDRIEIIRSRKSARLIKISNASFVELLRIKMNRS